MSEIRDAALSFEAQKVAFGQSKDGMILKLAIPADGFPKDLMLSPLYQRYMVAMVPIGDNEEPVVGPDKRASQKAIASAAMMVKNDRFQWWMHMKHHADDASEVSAVEALRKICGITSRSEFATNESARTTFEELRSQFWRDVKAGNVP